MATNQLHPVADLPSAPHTLHDLILSSEEEPAAEAALSNAPTLAPHAALRYVGSAQSLRKQEAPREEHRESVRVPGPDSAIHDSGMVPLRTDMPTPAVNLAALAALCVESSVPAGPPGSGRPKACPAPPPPPPAALEPLRPTTVEPRLHPQSESSIEAVPLAIEGMQRTESHSELQSVHPSAISTTPESAVPPREAGQPGLTSATDRMAWLVALSGSSLAQGHVVPLRFGARKSYRIGMEQACDVVVKASGISREHAEIVYEPASQRFLLVDLRSRNGTYLQTPQTALAAVSSSAELVDGSKIRFGREQIFFVFRCY